MDTNVLPGHGDMSPPGFLVLLLHPGLQVPVLLRPQGPVSAAGLGPGPWLPAPEEGDSLRAADALPEPRSRKVSSATSGPLLPQGQPCHLPFHQGPAQGMTAMFASCLALPTGSHLAGCHADSPAMCFLQIMSSNP